MKLYFLLLLTVTLSLYVAGQQKSVQEKLGYSRETKLLIIAVLYAVGVAMGIYEWKQRKFART